MGRLTPEKQAQLEALEAERDAADDDDYAWVRLSDDTVIRLEGKRLQNYLRKHGLDESDVEDSSKANPIDPTETGGAAVPGKKAAPAKKAVPGKKPAPAAGAAGEVDEGAEVDADEPPAQRRPTVGGFF